MAQVIVRQLDEAVIDALKRRAAARGVSLEQQLREILAEAARPSRAEVVAEMRRIRAMTGRRLASDSARLIREDRDRR